MYHDTSFDLSPKRSQDHKNTCILPLRCGSSVSICDCVWYIHSDLTMIKMVCIEHVKTFIKHERLSFTTFRNAKTRVENDD